MQTKVCFNQCLANVTIINLQQMVYFSDSVYITWDGFVSSEPLYIPDSGTFVSTFVVFYVS